MRIVFLGTNGWYDTEMGNTICTLVQTERWDILLDAGNGIHRAERYIQGDKPVFLFLSHFHVDHIEGLHILMRLPFRKGLCICGPVRSREILGIFLKEPFTLPVAALPYPVRILELPAEAAALPFTVEVFPLRHSVITLGFRIAVDERIVGYCPDTGYCENAVMLGRSADILITECAFKAGQSNEDWPHLTPETAARIAVEAGAKRLVLTHFDASLYRTPDERKEAQKVAAGIFPMSETATDKMQIML